MTSGDLSTMDTSGVAAAQSDSLLLYWSTSGGGGEYVITRASRGATARSLVDFEIALQTPLGIVRTGTVLRDRSNRLRVRLQSTQMHLSGQLAALMLLPNGGRRQPDPSAGTFLMEKHFVLDAELNFIRRSAGVAVLQPANIIARLGPTPQYPGNIIVPSDSRLEQVLSLHGASGNLTWPLQRLVAKHRQEILDAAGEGPNAGAGLEVAGATVSALMGELSVWEESYLPGTDPLPALLRLAGLDASAVETPAQVPDPGQIQDEPVEIRRRSEQIFRMTRARGASAASFRRAIQGAYRHTCAFCGFRAPGHPGLSQAGVDAAHILPWGRFDLDVPENGLVLCKQHHWAFDNHILILRYDAGNYFVDLAPDALTLIGGDLHTLRLLINCTGQIPPERLPHVDYRPNPQYIDKLYSSTG